MIGRKTVPPVIFNLSQKTQCTDDVRFFLRQAIPRTNTAVELLWEVDIVEGTRRRRLLIAVGTAPAVAVSTVAVVRGNAIAHVVLVPRCHEKPRKGRLGRCVLTGDPKLAVQSSSTDDGA